MPATDTTALITGAARGIGAAVAADLARTCAAVILVDRDADGLARVAASLRATGAVAHEVVADLSNGAGVPRAVAAVGDQRLDALALCAGVTGRTPIGSLTDSAVVESIASVNVRAPVQLVEDLLPALRRSPAPRVVAVTSIHTMLSERGHLAYTASKAALTAAMRTLAIELAADGILVNSVAPGFVDTAMSVLPDGRPEHETAHFRQAFLDTGRIPLGRVAEPEEIAHAVCFLLSPVNTYITGTTLVADGGLTATL